jgi:hypothetical protein
VTCFTITTNKSHWPLTLYSQDQVVFYESFSAFRMYSMLPLDVNSFTVIAVFIAVLIKLWYRWILVRSGRVLILLNTALNTSLHSWIAPCLFILFHKACWEVKQLAITRWLSPRLSRLKKELWRVKRFSLVSVILYDTKTRFCLIVVYATDWCNICFALCTECSHLLLVQSICDKRSKKLQYNFFQW